jgi:hypothetical protein
MSLDIDGLQETYSQLSREDIQKVGENISKNSEVIALVSAKKKDMASIVKIFNDTTANTLGETIRPMMLKTDITKIISILGLKGKESDIIYTALDKAIKEEVGEMLGGRRRRRKTKRSKRSKKTKRRSRK